jgi:hypothetical protein
MAVIWASRPPACFSRDVARVPRLDPTSSPPAPTTDFEISPRFGEYHARGSQGLFYVSGVALDAREYGRTASPS